VGQRKEGIMIFYADFTQIDMADIQRLITNAVPESRTLEYKQTLKIGSDGDKKEFLADVSAFANTDGGDIIYGLSADKGIASGW
jgi:predicted HTH transcriptional regulator